MDNLRTSAMARIQAAKYKGEKKDFGILKYFTVHSNTHNDLKSAGKIVTEGMKITYFMNRLMDTTAVTYAVGAKSEPGMATFQHFYNSFSAKLTSHITLTKATSNNKRISMPCMAITKGAEVEEVEAGAEEAEAAEKAVNTEEAIVVAEAEDIVTFAEGEEEGTKMIITMQLHGAPGIETITLMNGSPYPII